MAKALSVRILDDMKGKWITLVRDARDEWRRELRQLLVERANP
jgi:hypothetical protein